MEESLDLKILSAPNRIASNNSSRESLSLSFNRPCWTTIASNFNFCCARSTTFCSMVSSVTSLNTCTTFFWPILWIWERWLRLVRIGGNNYISIGFVRAANLTHTYVHDLELVYNEKVELCIEYRLLRDVSNIIKSVWWMKISLLLTNLPEDSSLSRTKSPRLQFAGWCL